MLRKTITTTILLLMALVLPQVGFSADLSMAITPQTVEINTFYNGTTVEVKGNVATDAEVLLLVRGAGEELQVKTKGKVGGLLWMNTGDLTFEKAPSAYMLYSSPALKDKIESSSIGHGYLALQKVVEITPSSDKDEFYFKEFIQLKVKQSLFSKDTTAVTYGPATGGNKPYQATLVIPPRMKQGAYTVEAYAIRADRVIAASTTKLDLKLVSFPAQLSKMAFDHSLLYGIMAVVIALLAGLITGILFKDKGGAH